MGQKSSIEWTDATWSPIRARVKQNAAEIAEQKGYTSLIQIAEKMAGRFGQHCEHVSDGCKNCYAERDNGRCLPSHGTGLPYDRRSRDLVDVFIDEKMLVQPLKWRTPKKIFVENQSDLFGEWVPDELIDRVFAVMSLCPQHCFQILTKRPERMFSYFSDFPADCLAARITAFQWEIIEDRVDPNERRSDDMRATCIDPDDDWPLPNVWLGVSCEDQPTADERIPWLLKTPAAVRFVSYEPALGPVDFRFLQPRDPPVEIDALNGTHGVIRPHRGTNPKLDWIIVGGESGPGARPFNIQHARDVIRQCREAGVACFVKQLGAHPMVPSTKKHAGETAKERAEREDVEFHKFPDGTYFGNRTGDAQWNGYEVILKDKKGGDWKEWPEEDRVREFPAMKY